jgi:hypothetical protein
MGHLNNTILMLVVSMGITLFNTNSMQGLNKFSRQILTAPVRLEPSANVATGFDFRFKEVKDLVVGISFAPNGNNVDETATVVHKSLIVTIAMYITGGIGTLKVTWDQFTTSTDLQRLGLDHNSLGFGTGTTVTKRMFASNVLQRWKAVTKVALDRIPKNLDAKMAETTMLKVSKLGRGHGGTIVLEDIASHTNGGWYKPSLRNVTLSRLL